MQNGFLNHLSVLGNQGHVTKALHSNLEQYSANAIVLFGKPTVQSAFRLYARNQFTSNPNKKENEESCHSSFTRLQANSIKYTQH